MLNGHQIKAIYDAMRGICEENSRMLSCAMREFVTVRGWEFANPNSGVMWATSTSYLFPRRWMPLFQQMVFRPGNGDGKRGVGVHVMFDEDGDALKNAIPFISCGVLTWGETGTVTRCDELYEAGWLGTSGFITHDAPFYDTKFTKRGCSEILNYFLPLDAISSEEKIVSLVVEPLIQLFHGQKDAVIARIAAAAITVEQIKQPAP
jgi:hypothetical protein